MRCDAISPYDIGRPFMPAAITPGPVAFLARHLREVQCLYYYIAALRLRLPANL